LFVTHRFQALPPLAVFTPVGHVIGTVMTATVQTAREGIGEARHMSAGFPDSWMHGDGRIKSHHVVSQMNVVAPPQALDVILEFNSQRPIVPRRSEPAVNFARLKYKTAPLAQRHDLVHVDHQWILSKRES
jgi:hypothetical protein